MTPAGFEKEAHFVRKHWAGSLAVIALFLGAYTYKVHLAEQDQAAVIINDSNLSHIPINISELRAIRENNTASKQDLKDAEDEVIAGSILLMVEGLNLLWSRSESYRDE